MRIEEGAEERRGEAGRAEQTVGSIGTFSARRGRGGRFKSLGGSRSDLMMMGLIPYVGERLSPGCSLMRVRGYGVWMGLSASRAACQEARPVHCLANE